MRCVATARRAAHPGHRARQARPCAVAHIPPSLLMTQRRSALRRGRLAQGIWLLSVQAMKEICAKPVHRSRVRRPREAEGEGDLGSGREACRPVLLRCGRRTSSCRQEVPPLELPVEGAPVRRSQGPPTLQVPHRQGGLVRLRRARARRSPGHGLLHATCMQGRLSGRADTSVKARSRTVVWKRVFRCQGTLKASARGSAFTGPFTTSRADGALRRRPCPSASECSPAARRGAVRGSAEAAWRSRCAAPAVPVAVRGTDGCRG
ncbi:hypothetical protein H181DRAFT_00034 [Streptomyces sp. WMMB 714]|nr:hypothetical protein H181DRAFT_00034 [Streptomyces sp. WMMB 714]